jgi:hypothetical protein
MFAHGQKKHGGEIPAANGPDTLKGQAASVNGRNLQLFIPANEGMRR